MYNDILLPVDLTEQDSWPKALSTAIDYCKTFGARLHVMTVVPDYKMAVVGSYFPSDFESKHREEANRQIHEFVTQHIPEGIQVQHIVTEGTIYEQIVNTAKTVKADLIVMAAHRPELADYFLGPTAERVIRHASVSVLVVRE